LHNGTECDLTPLRNSASQICYCGGEISATVELFVLSHLGYDNLTLYTDEKSL